MSTRSIFMVAAMSLFLVCHGSKADTDNSKGAVSQVLAAFVNGEDHLKKLRELRDQITQYPNTVAALTDYKVFGHGTLLDLLFEEEGAAIVRALDEKLKTQVECLAKYVSICQPSLADRNEVILSALWYYDQEKMSR